MKAQFEPLQCYSLLFFRVSKNSVSGGLPVLPSWLDVIWRGWAFWKWNHILKMNAHFENESIFWTSSMLLITVTVLAWRHMARMSCYHSLLLLLITVTTPYCYHFLLLPLLTITTPYCYHSLLLPTLTVTTPYCYLLGLTSDGEDELSELFCWTFEE